jgi:hypothetical protein
MVMLQQAAPASCPLHVYYLLLLTSCIFSQVAHPSACSTGQLPPACIPPVLGWQALRGAGSQVCCLCIHTANSLIQPSQLTADKKGQ